jgi:hypothetical protein
MTSILRDVRILVGLFSCAVAVFSAPARAALSASAIVSTSQTAAPFDYTITLTNNGTTTIGTFWFAWTATPANYDFLPTSPTNVTVPAGWTSLITHNGFPGDGYGLEMYNVSGSPIGPGQLGLFQFTSPNTPAQLAGNAFFPPNKVTTSFVYIGAPLGDPGFKFNAQVVPEPALAGLLSIGACAIGIAARRPTRSFS